MNFTYYQPTELIVGKSKIEILPETILKYGNKALVIGPQMNDAIKPMFERIEKLLQDNNIQFTTYYEVEPNPSTITVDNALKLSNENDVDVIVAIGGGSTMDTAKTVGLFGTQSTIDWPKTFETYTSYSTYYQPISENAKPVIAVPTTAGTGSQCTQACVITDVESKMKNTIFHQMAYAKVAIIDPELTMTLPQSITSSTAFDAFSHAFEAYLKNDGNIIAEQMSLQSISWIADNLPKVLQENKIEYREKLAMADTFGGIALANCGACLPHPLSEIIGSYIGRISHGHALALVYPTFIKYTYEKYQSKYAKVCRIFDKSYADKSDEVAAQAFDKVLTNFMVSTNLLSNIRQYETDENKIQEIKQCPIWNHLNMEDTQVIIDIVNEICEEGEKK